MNHDIVFKKALEWLYNPSKGPFYVGHHRGAWNAACASVGRFLGINPDDAVKSITELATKTFGPGWYETWGEKVGSLSLQNITPKRFGGDGAGMRDVTGVWEYLVRQEKKGILKG